MKPRSLALDKRGIDLLNKDNQTQVFPSVYNFLNVHRGLRPGRFHVLVGSTGIGKSSITKQIVYDCAKAKRVSWWLSEENYESCMLNCKDSWKEELNHKRIQVWCEADNKSGRDGMMDALRQAIIMSDVLIFDNLSTSALYEELSPNDKSEFVRKLKDFCYEKRTTCLVISHTSKNAQTGYKLMTDADVRGVHTLCNIAEYLYLVQRIMIEGKIKTLLQVYKHRYHAIEDRIFQLYFDVHRKIYNADSPVDTQIAYELLGNRDGGRQKN